MLLNRRKLITGLVSLPPTSADIAIYNHRAQHMGPLPIHLSTHDVFLRNADGSLICCGDIPDGSYRYRVSDGQLVTVGKDAD